MISKVFGLFQRKREEVLRLEAELAALDKNLSEIRNSTALIQQDIIFLDHINAALDTNQLQYHQVMRMQ